MNKKLLIIILLLLNILSTSCSKNELDLSMKLMPTPKPIKITMLSTDTKVGDSIQFGLYEQDNISSNGKEKIFWRVLSIENGNAILISEYGLDVMPYHYKSDADVTWEECSLRTWLNDSFYDNSFNENEKSKILLKTLRNGNNPESGAIGGNPTKDKVYLLSIDEVLMYSPSRTTPTIFAKTKRPDVTKSGICDWWLRTPGAYGFLAATADMTVFPAGYVVVVDDVTVRPVISVKLES